MESAAAEGVGRRERTVSNPADPPGTTQFSHAARPTYRPALPRVTEPRLPRPPGGRPRGPTPELSRISGPRPPKNPMQRAPPPALPLCQPLSPRPFSSAVGATPLTKRRCAFVPRRLDTPSLVSPLAVRWTQRPGVRDDRSSCALLLWARPGATGRNGFSQRGAAAIRPGRTCLLPTYLHERNRVGPAMWERVVVLGGPHIPRA